MRPGMFSTLDGRLPFAFDNPLPPSAVAAASLSGRPGY
jgi:hypothetical protein